jgi:hypothetical protein
MFTNNKEPDGECDCEPKWLQILLALIAAGGGILAEKGIEYLIEKYKNSEPSDSNDSEKKDPTTPTIKKD